MDAQKTMLVKYNKNILEVWNTYASSIFLRIIIEIITINITNQIKLIEFEMH